MSEIASALLWQTSCEHGHGEVVQLNGHRHMPGCGHDLVHHDDHLDYVGDDGLLHHLLEPDRPVCCDHHAAAVQADQGPLVVSHGMVPTLTRRYFHEICHDILVVS